MGEISVSDVVFVNFPFSDLSRNKLRPALVLAYAGYNDWILCQITSQAYDDIQAIAIKETLNKLFPFMVRQAHHERKQLLAVRPELVEGLFQSFLE